MKNIKCVTAREAAGYEKLIELHQGNEAAARKAWEENGYVVPEEAMALVSEDVKNNAFIVEDVKEVDPVLIAKQKSIRKIKAALTSKLKRLNQLVDKHTGYQKIIDQMQPIIDDIDTVSAEESLVAFISAADSMTASAEKWFAGFDDGSKIPTFENLKRIEDAISAIGLVKDLTADMFENEENKEIYKTVGTIVGKYAQLYNKYINHSRKLLSKEFQGNFNKIITQYEKQAEIVFNKVKKPYVDKKDIPQAKAEFIAKYMTSHATEIDLQTHQYIENMLLQTVDIPTLAAFIVNPKDMNHDIISLAVESLDKADMQIWTTMESVVDDSEELNEKFVNYVGKTSDPKKQYELFFVKDDAGNITPEIVNSEHPTQFKAFKEQYGHIPEVWDMYQHLTKLIEEKDKMIYSTGKLSYKLPRLEQNNLERLYSNGILSFVKEGLLDKVKLRGKDVELGLLTDDMLESKKIKAAKATEDTYVTESGEERAVIPLHYRNIKIDDDKVSYDVMRSIVLDYHNCLKFKTKTESAVFLDVLKDVMHEADTIATTSFINKLKVNKETQELHTTKNGVNNVTKTLEMLIRHRVYGIAIEGDPTVTKMFQSLSNYTSLLAMSANVVSGAANILQGTVVGWIEAAGGKTGYFTPANRVKAMKEYNLHIPEYIKDVGERVPKAKVNLVARKFNIFSESHLFNGKAFTQNNKFKRIAETSAIMAATNIGEHALQSINMLSVLDNVKVKDVHGNYLKKDFTPTTDREEAIGIYDALLQDGTKLEFHPSVNSTERTKGVGEEDMLKIHRMITRISRDIYGNYSSTNKARYQRTAPGALMGSMRGYLISGMQKRFRGIGTSGIMSKESYVALEDEFTFDNLHRLSYNTELNKFEQGQYVTTAKFIRDMITEVKALRSIAGAKDVWNAMTDDQKGNVRKTVIEMALIAGFFLLSNMFDDDKEDPNDIENLYAAYLTRRMYSELATYININETIRTFRSPAVAIGTIEAVLKAGLQLVTDPTEVYDGGRHSGEYKLWRDIKKLIPVYKQVDRNLEDSYLFLKR